MNKGILTTLLLAGALASPAPLMTRAVGQEQHEQQPGNPDQNTQQDRSRHEEQRWSSDYTYEETVDRDWLKEQQKKRNNPHRSQADYTNEETVDRNWLNEHNLD